MSLQMATKYQHLLTKTVPAWCNVVEIGVKKFVRIAPAAQATVKLMIAQAQQALAAKFANTGTSEGGEAGSSSTAAVAAPVGSAAVGPAEGVVLSGSDTVKPTIGMPQQQTAAMDDRHL
ncbi:hypothetical protein GGF31_004665 [Allomyces arbusculus]|nr:hypothetical protein GGF31_004665 [Allomyces arbusculus]